MKKTFFILLLLTCVGQLFSQEIGTINGTIHDLETGSPIAYATISYELAGTHGTISNDAGTFELFDVPLGTTIEISHLLYEPQSYTLSNLDSLQINLTTATLALPTAVVDGKYAQQLAQKAFEKAMATEQIYKGKGFYRQLTKIDSAYTEAIESFTNIHFSNKKIESWEVVEGRYGKIKKESLRFNNFSNFTRSFPLYFPPPKRKRKIRRKKKKTNAVIALSDQLDKFEVEVEQFLQKANGQEIAVIHCIPKNTSDKQTDLFIESWYYIDTETFEIYKMKSVLPHSLGIGRGSNWQIRKPLFTYQINYKKDAKRGMVLDFIQVASDLSIHEKNGQFAFKIEVNSLFYCYAIFDANKKKLGKNQENIDDLAVASEAGYNPAFWENHPIIKKTPLENKVMEDFEKAGFFGNFLNDQ